MAREGGRAWRAEATAAAATAEGMGSRSGGRADGLIQAGDDDVALVQAAEDLGVGAVGDADLEMDFFRLGGGISTGQAVNIAKNRGVGSAAAPAAAGEEGHRPLGNLDAALLGQFLDLLDHFGGGGCAALETGLLENFPQRLALLVLAELLGRCRRGAVFGRLLPG